MGTGDEPGEPSRCPRAGPGHPRETFRAQPSLIPTCLGEAVSFQGGRLMMPDPKGASSWGFTPPWKRLCPPRSGEDFHLLPTYKLCSPRNCCSSSSGRLDQGPSREPVGGDRPPGKSHTGLSGFSLRSSSSQPMHRGPRSGGFYS